MKNFFLPGRFFIYGMKMNALTIRKIGVAGIGDLLSSTKSVGWEIFPEDVKMMIDDPHSGAFVAFSGDRVAGTGCFSGNDDGSTVFISLITAKEEFRRQGIATEMMKTIFVANPHAKTFRLFASDMGKPLYEKLGFTARRRVGFIAGTVEGANRLGDASQVKKCDHLEPWMLAWDEKYVAPKRRELLEFAVQRENSLIFALPDQAGFAFGRKFDRGVDVSLVEAATLQNALDLVSAFSATASPQDAVAISVAEYQTEFQDRLASCGFKAAHIVTDMIRGEEPPAPRAEYFALYSYIG